MIEGLFARLVAILHFLVGHEVYWRACAEEWDGGGCSGDITCETCGIMFWCRAKER